jgi:hypothetical protein
VQGQQVIGVARDRPAPEGDVDTELPLGALALELQRGDVDRRRDGVQRHVRERRDAAGGRGEGGGGEPLPLGAARLVHVDVAVHQARQ